jgi:hypothetical protein
MAYVMEVGNITIKGDTKIIAKEKGYASLPGRLTG